MFSAPLPEITPLKVRDVARLSTSNVVVVLLVSAQGLLIVKVLAPVDEVPVAKVPPFPTIEGVLEPILAAEVIARAPEVKFSPPENVLAPERVTILLTVLLPTPEVPAAMTTAAVPPAA